MKTQVVQLENYDDSISVRDKMGWGQTNRILLVWPTHGVVLNRRLDLVLLQRHSQSLGAQMALVTRDPEVCDNALDLGIPVFKDARQAQRGRWRVNKWRRARSGQLTRPADPARRANLRQHFDAQNAAQRAAQQPANSRGLRVWRWAARWLPFSLSLLAVLALLGTILPSAQIQITPGTQTQEIIVPIQASADLTAVNLAGGLPARWHSLSVEGRSSLPVSGTVSVPEKPASGEVSFTSLSTAPLTIPAGTLVSTLNQNGEGGVIRFATLEKVNVPAGVNQTARVRVQAVLPGKEGNQPAGAIQAVEGPLGLLFRVSNPQALRGGVSQNVPGPNEADRQKIYQRLLQSLQRSAETELITAWQASPLSANLPVTPTLQVSEVLTSTYTPASGLPGANLELTLRVEFKVLVVAGSDLKKLAGPVLDAGLQPGQRALPETLQTFLVQPLRLNAAGQAAGKLRFSRMVEQVVTAAETANLGRGLPAPQAGLLLQQQLQLAQPAQIQLWPDWWPYLPLLPMRIDVAEAGLINK